jgi:hypothetical protein
MDEVVGEREEGEGEGKGRGEGEYTDVTFRYKRELQRR